MSYFCTHQQSPDKSSYIHGSRTLDSTTQSDRTEKKLKSHTDACSQNAGWKKTQSKNEGRKETRPMPGTGDEGEDEDGKVEWSLNFCVINHFHVWYTYLHAAARDLELTMDLENSFIQ